MNRTPYDIVHTVLRPLRGLGLRKFPLIDRILGALKPHIAIMQGGRTVFLDPADFVVSQEISRGAYESIESSIIMKLVRSDDTVIDLGANIGFYTILFCDAVPRGQVHAFEPSPKTFDFLEKNISVNGFKNAHLYEMAVGENDGNAEIFINGYNKGDNRLYASFGVKGVPIKVTKLDSVIPPGTKVDLIKMDIQGFEVHALRGMQRVLRENPDLYIVCECYPKGLRRADTSIEEFLTLLENAGFSWCMINDEKNELRKISKTQLIEQFPSDKDGYTNLLCWRNRQLPDSLIVV